MTVYVVLLAATGVACDEFVAACREVRARWR